MLLETWENFCRSCTKLRRFSWLTVPLDDHYLQVFAKYPKPHLDKIQITAGDLSQWGQSIARSRSPNGLHISTESLGQMLQAYPALKRLFVLITLQVANVINDEFLVRVSQQCKLVYLLEAQERLVSESADPPSGFSDQGLLAIRSLPHLTSIKLKAPCLMAETIYTLMIRSPEPAMFHSIELTQRNEMMFTGGSSFLDLVCELLEELMTPAAGAILDSDLNVYMMLRIHDKYHKIAMENTVAVNKTLKDHVDRFRLRYPEIIFQLECSTVPSTIYDNLHDISGIVIKTMPEVW